METLRGQQPLIIDSFSPLNLADRAASTENTVSGQNRNEIRALTFVFCGSGKT